MRSRSWLKKKSGCCPKTIPNWQWTRSESLPRSGSSWNNQSKKKRSFKQRWSPREQLLEIGKTGFQLSMMNSTPWLSKRRGSNSNRCPRRSSKNWSWKPGAKVSWSSVFRQSSSLRSSHLQRRSVDGRRVETMKRRSQGRKVSQVAGMQRRLESWSGRRQSVSGVGRSWM